MRTTSIIRRQKANEYKMTKTKIQTTELSWSFHFLNIWEEGHGNMPTMVSNLLPWIERSHLWFSEDVELLFCAQIAPSCHRVEGSPPVEHLPFNIEGGAPGLELPDVGAQLGLVLLVWNDIYYAFFAYFTIYASRLDWVSWLSSARVDSFSLQLGRNINSKRSLVSQWLTCKVYDRT